MHWRVQYIEINTDEPRKCIQESEMWDYVTLVSQSPVERFSMLDAISQSLSSVLYFQDLYLQKKIVMCMTDNDLSTWIWQFYKEVFRKIGQLYLFKMLSLRVILNNQDSRKILIFAWKTMTVISKKIWINLSIIDLWLFYLSDPHFFCLFKKYGLYLYNLSRYSAFVISSLAESGSLNSESDEITKDITRENFSSSNFHYLLH